VLRVRSRDGSWVSRIEDSMRLVALVSTGVLCLAPSFYQASHERADVHDFAGWRGEQRATEQIFWINAALDLLYVGIGAALAMGGKTDQTRGTGFGVLAQGGFLLTFDTTAALLHGE